MTSPLGERMEVASTGLSVEFNFALFAIVGVIAAVAVSLIPKRIAETPAVALDVEREAARD